MPSKFDTEEKREHRRQWFRDYYRSNPTYRARQSANAKARRERGSYAQFKKRVITFQGTQLSVKVSPRTGICSKCGAVASDRQHIMHHEKYDPSDVLAHTIEVCRSCHAKIHYANGNLKKGNATSARLTELQVAKIRTRYLMGDITQRELANMYGVSDSQISRIVLGQQWKSSSLGEVR